MGGFGDAAHWECSRKFSPKDVVKGGKLRAGRRPFNRNLLLDIVITFSALPLLAYCAAAIFVVPAVVGFLPVTITLIILVPTAVLGAGLLPVQWVRKFLASRLAARKAKARPQEERDVGAEIEAPEADEVEATAQSDDDNSDEN